MQRLHSHESGQRPLTNVPYSQAPYQDNYYNMSNQYLPARAPPSKRGTSKWIKIGIPVIVIVIAAAVIAAVVAIKKHDSVKASGSGTSAGASGSGGKAGTIAGSTSGLFPIATDTYFLPVYPSATNDAFFVAPTFAASPTATWPAETFLPATPNPTEVRPDRPRLVATAGKWAALPSLIQQDPYLEAYHKQILINATFYKTLPPVARVVDGGSGILDVSRQVKERIKAWAYAYRMTNDTAWVDAAWGELQHAAGNKTGDPFGTPPDLWNSGHFLDVAEMTSAFAIGYDWLYDVWTPEQRTAIMWSIINTGLQFGLEQYNTAAGWWTGSNGQVISGNWNCVNNAGMTLGALAILGDDPTGIAQQIIGLSIPNANKNCVLGPSTDGTWTETPNYWYFGTTGHAELTSALISAAGSDFGLLTTNFNLTGIYHMYVFGMTSLFDNGDHGPNKYSSTANSMMFYGHAFDNPRYMLYQRDRFDAPSDPWAIFWYDPSVAGAWWNGLPLDHHFDDPETNWASMRSSWTDDTQMYVAMKSSKLLGHQTHGDLDCGDFVLDAMGQRWFGELGSGNYLSDDYFSSEADNATRWLYYRKRTEGQNTILIDAANQIVEAVPTSNFDTDGVAQGSDTEFTVPAGSTAFFTTDMSSAYPSGNSLQRGIRMINSRKQVLLQDDINTQGAIMWRAHTNATVTTSGSTATLALHGKTLTAQILSPSGATFTTMPAVRLASDPPTPTDAASQDQPNPGVTVLTINVPAGQVSIQVLFNPQWDGSSAADFVTPPSVDVSSWSLHSHDGS